MRAGLGYEYLSFQEQQVYKVMLKAFSSFAGSFPCPQIGRGVDLMKVLHTVLGDNPSVIYFDRMNIQTVTSILEKRVDLTGVCSREQAEKAAMSLEETADKIVSLVRAEGGNEYSRLLKLYELLQKNIKYDHDELKAVSRGTSKNPVSHNAYGALIHKKAVCDGFSSAFALLAQKLGFECMMVVGRSAYAAASFTEHAWNVIKIKRKYYHMDLTWDARKFDSFKEFSYEYFALTGEELSRDHSWDKKAVPLCSDRNYSYYSKNGLYADNTEELKKIVKAINKKNADVFRLKISRNIKLPDNDGDYLSQVVLDEVTRPGMRSRASYSWNENTRCFFARVSFST